MLHRGLGWDPATVWLLKFGDKKEQTGAGVGGQVRIGGVWRIQTTFLIYDGGVLVPGRRDSAGVKG